jgi:glycosyltransferase involved in cell wall biosynthesis
MGHTEYKISPGMALGLPVIASPQISYIEALSGRQAGIIAVTAEDWREALHTIGRDSATRERMGRNGRATVDERYSTAVVADRYHRVLLELTRNGLYSSQRQG